MLEMGTRGRMVRVHFPERDPRPVDQMPDLWSLQEREIELAAMLQELLDHWVRWHYAGHQSLHRELKAKCERVLAGPSGSALKSVRGDGILMTLRSLRELGYTDAEELIRAEMEEDGAI